MKSLIETQIDNNEPGWIENHPGLFKVILAIWLMIILGIVGGACFESGRAYEIRNCKHWQAASILSDVCHNACDNLGTDFEEIYYDYLDNLDTDSTLLITKKELESYHYCY